MEDRKVIYVVTKWQTKGIVRKMAEIKMSEDFETEDKYERAIVSYYPDEVYDEGQYFYTREEAEAKCDKLRLKEIERLERKIEKLKKLSFERKEPRV